LEPPRDGLAIASFICSLVWFFGLGSLLGVILGIAGLRSVRRSRGARTGDGYAIAGILVGALGLAVTILIAVVIVSFVKGHSEVTI
jgi:hypothetical protein